MSFTTTIKNEISKLNITKVEMIAELSGFFRNNITINKDQNQIYLLTENENIV